MSTVIAIALLVTMVLVGWRVLGSGLERPIARALAHGDVAPLLEAIARRSLDAQPDAYNHAIRRLWDAYQRPLAVPLIRVLAEQHPNQRIAQYWLGQLQQVEPLLARESLGDAFFESYFQPHVAATCGKVG
ncbi:MAG: hypothetical protein ABIJ09_06285 [Pseudomonadota bacterium]